MYIILGECITSAMNGSVCDLNSVAVECENLTATKCFCNDGYKLSSESALTCDGRSNFSPKKLKISLKIKKYC